MPIILWPYKDFSVYSYYIYLLGNIVNRVGADELSLCRWSPATTGPPRPFVDHFLFINLVFAHLIPLKMFYCMLLTVGVKPLMKESLF